MVDGLYEMYNSTPGVKSFMYKNIYVDITLLGKKTFCYALRRRAEGEIFKSGEGNRSDVVFRNAINEIDKLYE